jgi:hypothetical protein
VAHFKIARSLERKPRRRPHAAIQVAEKFENRKKIIPQGLKEAV